MAFKFAMERPCDVRIASANSSADHLELWFSDKDCFALVCGKKGGWGESSQDLFLITRMTSGDGKIMWSSRKLTDKGMSLPVPLNYKLSAEIDKQYNEWRMNKLIEESLCESSNSAPT